MIHKFPRSCLMLCTCFLLSSLSTGCKQEAKNPIRQTSESPPGDTFEGVFVALHNSCMPCHNHSTLPTVIARVKTADFSNIDGETRLRILGELEELKVLMDQGLPLSFVNKDNIHNAFTAMPGAFYTMLEKGSMPPSWAPRLMQEINWPHYVPLNWDKRIELLKYAKPYSEKYLR